MIRTALAVGVVLATAGAARAEPYAIEHALPAAIVAGQPAEISLTITPEAGFSIPGEGPLWIDVASRPDGALALRRARYRRVDAADPRARAPRFDIRFTPQRPGAFELRLKTQFWLCQRRSCRPVRDERVVEVVVREAPGE